VRQDSPGGGVDGRADATIRPGERGELRVERLRKTTGCRLREDCELDVRCGLQVSLVRSEVVVCLSRRPARSPEAQERPGGEARRRARARLGEAAVRLLARLDVGGRSHGEHNRRGERSYTATT